MGANAHMQRERKEKCFISVGAVPTCVQRIWQDYVSVSVRSGGAVVSYRQKASTQ